MKILILSFMILSSCAVQKPQTLEGGDNYNSAINNTDLSASTFPQGAFDFSAMMLQVQSWRPQKADYSIILKSPAIEMKVTFALLSHPMAGLTYYIQTDPTGFIAGGQDPNMQYSAQRLQLVAEATVNGQKAMQITGTYKVIAAGAAPAQEVTVEVDLQVNGQRLVGTATGIWASYQSSLKYGSGGVVLKSATSKTTGTFKSSSSTGIGTETSGFSGQQQNSGGYSDSSGTFN